MTKANQEMRTLIDDCGLEYWRVAEEVGIHPTTFTVWLRTPLDEEKETKIAKAIEELISVNNTA